MGILDKFFGRKDEPKPDFSGVRGGASTSAPSTPAAAPRAGISHRTYTVQQGDSLSKIAQREYGAAGKWHAIYAANKDKIKDPDLIFPGQILTLPDNV